MAEKKSDIQRMAPDDLMKNFSQTRFVNGFLLAIVVHIAVIGVTSLQYIWRTWVVKGEPEPPAAAAPAQTESAAVEQTEPAKQKPETEKTADTTPEQRAKTEHEMQMEKYKDTPTVKEITDAASPDEIPSMPDALGISIQDTNPF